MGELPVRLRPLVVDDLAMFRRFATEPGLVGLDWSGFRDAEAPARRFATDGYLGGDDGRLMVEVDGGPAAEPIAAGFVSWHAQAMLCDYLFAHTPAQRIEAGTHPENIAEQKALEKAGFRHEGVLRSVEFRNGQWRDGWLYSRLRDDPPATQGAGGGRLS